MFTTLDNQEAKDVTKISQPLPLPPSLTQDSAQGTFHNWPF